MAISFVFDRDKLPLYHTCLKAECARDVWRLLGVPGQFLVLAGEAARANGDTLLDAGGELQADWFKLGDMSRRAIKTGVCQDAVSVIDAIDHLNGLVVSGDYDRQFPPRLTVTVFAPCDRDAQQNAAVRTPDGHAMHFSPVVLAESGVG